ncbi:nitroreductase family protein [Peptoniphilus sp. SGI.035]|uniref:nitroreductase family protein n=1 Tax=unclassified Peptoniphilus TaxID=2637196 RepID=UPI0025DE2D37|nr:nitroreductase family protein [Peptoniphilus sp.]MCI5643247.1 nitroreductase family protein [Peptoniphilus sp.]MDY3902378.1 nitroreductase family protein [Peptoniphilus sp.]
MQNYIEIIKKRRSYYDLSEDVPLTNEEIKYLIEDVLNTTPSHMNSQTTRVVLLFDEKSKDFWKRVNETYDNKINEEKFLGFYHAKGTALIFIDKDEIREQEKNMSLYKEYFETWGQHSAAMVQLNIWQALRDEEIGASNQHYNPHIDSWVKDLYEIPDSWELIAEMPFGKIEEEPEENDKKPIDEILKVIE